MQPFRSKVTAKPGQLERYDYEYRRNDAVQRKCRSPSPYLSGLFGLGLVGRPVGSVMFFASGLVAGPWEPDSGFLSRD
jgi:hypothetical protein